MNYKAFRRAAVALGVSSVAVLTAVTSYGAQTSPRGLPAAPPSQNQNDGQYGAQAPQTGQQDRRGNFTRRNPVERRLDYLHTRLRIRADQEHLWNDFADSERDQVRGLADRFQDFRDRRGGQERDRNVRPGEPTVLDRLQDQERALDQRRDGLDRMIRALRPLYAALDDRQKQIADDEFFRPERMQNRFFRPMPGFNRSGFNQDDRSGLDGVRGDDQRPDSGNDSDRGNF